MKKSLVALAALAAINVYAQSSVTMYGAVEPTVDFAYKNTIDVRSENFNAAGVRTSITSTHSQAKNSFRVQDGNNQGTGTSRIGFRGTEDLGGGLKANFQLEMGLRVDDGCVTTGAGNVCSSGDSGGNLFGRNAWLGIGGNLGEVRMGRQVLGSFGVQANSWAAGASNGLYDAGSRVTPTMGGVRFSNSIKYMTPNMSGFRGTFTVAAPEGNAYTTTTSATGVRAVTADTKNKTGYDLAGEYANGPLYLGLGYNRTNGSTGTSNGVAPPLGSVSAGSNPTKMWTFGAAYDFGVIKPFLNHTRARGNVNGTTNLNGFVTTTAPVAITAAALAAGGIQATGDTKQRATTIGLRAPIGAATLITSYGRNKIDGSSVYLTNNLVDDRVATSFRDKAAQIGAQYPLSKRTLLEVNVGRYKRDGTARSTDFSTAGVVTGSQLTTTTQKESAVNFGIRHTF